MARSNSNGAAVSATADLSLRKRGEPALDLIEPGSRGRREVHVEARIAAEPAFDGRSLVSAVVVHDQMHVEFLRHCFFNGAQELQELLRAMPAMQFTDHFAVAMFSAANSVVVPCRL